MTLQHAFVHLTLPVISLFLSWASLSHTHTSQRYWEVKFKRSPSVAYKEWLSQAIYALQKSRFLSSLSGIQAGSGEPLQASVPGCEQQPQLPALSHTRKFFWINFPSFCVIRKQECLWLCLAKTSAVGIVRVGSLGLLQISMRSCTD